MNKRPTDPDSVPDETASETPAPARKSAVKFPDHIRKVGSTGPKSQGFKGSNFGKPQKDFARRAGKNRKVH